MTTDNAMTWRAEYLALELLFIALLRRVQRTDPAWKTVLAQLAADGREVLRSTSAADELPEMSDLLSGEVQDAWDRLLEKAVLPQ